MFPTLSRCVTLANAAASKVRWMFGSRRRIESNGVRAGGNDASGALPETDRRLHLATILGK